MFGNVRVGYELAVADVEAEQLFHSRGDQGVKCWVVTTSHGELLGVLFRSDADRAVSRQPLFMAA